MLISCYSDTIMMVVLIAHFVFSINEE